MKVTLKDISQTTGFSISTVSRALRGEGRISEDHRHKILETAHQLGYQLPQVQKSKKSLDNSYIAVITQFHTGEFYASFYDGFTKAANQLNCVTSLFNAPVDLNSTEKMISNLRNLGYSAAVLFIPGMIEKQYRQLLYATPKDFPIISCCNINNPVLDTVTFDAYRGATLVAKHFTQQGFEEMGLILGPQDMPEARFRSNGFNDFIKQQKDARITWTFDGDYTLEKGIEAFNHFSQLKNKPRAIFAANDAMAMGFMESARKEGWKFPEDIAIAGYDNLPLCQHHWPQLTSVDTNYQLLGRNTLKNLIARIGHNDQHQGMVSLVPVSLKIRKSSLNGDGKELKRTINF